MTAGLGLFSHYLIGRWFAEPRCSDPYSVHSLQSEPEGPFPKDDLVGLFGWAVRFRRLQFRYEQALDSEVDAEVDPKTWSAFSRSSIERNLQEACNHRARKASVLLCYDLNLQPKIQPPGHRYFC